MEWVSGLTLAQPVKTARDWEIDVSMWVGGEKCELASATYVNCTASIVGNITPEGVAVVRVSNVKQGAFVNLQVELESRLSKNFIVFFDPVTT